MADLAPRDVVSRAIIAEMKERYPNVYLDISQNRASFCAAASRHLRGEYGPDIDIAMLGFVVPCSTTLWAALKPP
jgi:succinate dehydrogenase/fumarate reductase flavoprotein subunit